MYDVHRRLHLMRATKAHVMRRGFGKHCRVIAEVGTEQLLKAMALHGESADLRELLRDPQVDVSLKRALGGVLQATSSIIGMEGHRSQIRLRGHAAGWHFGSAHVFVTPNLADIRSPLLLQLHLQRPIATVETCKIDLDWDLEMPGMPTAAAMRRIVATDPVSQARCFALMMDIFFEEVLGILPPLKRESYRVGVHATFEDGVASSLQGGIFGDVAALSGPLEKPCSVSSMIRNWRSANNWRRRSSHCRSTSANVPSVVVSMIVVLWCPQSQMATNFERQQKAVWLREHA